MPHCSIFRFPIHSLADFLKLKHWQSDIVMTSVVFSANPRGDATKFSIALLVNGAQLDCTLRLQHILEDRLLVFGAQLQAMLNLVRS